MSDLSTTEWGCTTLHRRDRSINNGCVHPFFRTRFALEETWRHHLLRTIEAIQLSFVLKKRLSVDPVGFDDVCFRSPTSHTCSLWQFLLLLNHQLGTSARDRSLVLIRPLKRQRLPDAFPRLEQVTQPRLPCNTPARTAIGALPIVRRRTARDTYTRIR
jgi:hypothetical protein